MLDNYLAGFFLLDLIYILLAELTDQRPKSEIALTPFCTY